MRMVGWGSRKSRRPLVVTEPRASANSRRPSQTSGPSTRSKNTKLKCLTSFILRNAANNVTGSGKWQRPSAITSSENTVDVIVEKDPGAAVEWRLQSVTQTSNCRDRRTLSGDRSRSFTGHQLQLVNATHTELLTKRVIRHAAELQGLQGVGARVEQGGRAGRAEAQVHVTEPYSTA